MKTGGLLPRKKIGNPDFDQSVARVGKLIAWAELSADAHTLGHINNQLEAYLREQRINRLCVAFGVGGEGSGVAQAKSMDRPLAKTSVSAQMRLTR
jgi:hypothetical protein